MIILFEKDEHNFTSLGLGILKDAISCLVTEGLNDKFELEMEYPISGNHFSDIKNRRIIFTKPNQYDNPQAFRIYNITKPINGTVTINAEHISYDMNGYVVKPFIGSGISDSLQKIHDNSLPITPFIFTTNKTSDVEMRLSNPCNMRSLLQGEGSLIDIYGGEYKFDMFNAALLNERGADRGVSIKYGKNMLELEQESNSQNLYSGVFPFYYKEATETKTGTEKYYQEVYIVNDIPPYSHKWFSLTVDGKSLYPIIENTPVQIKTDGPYKDKVLYFLNATVENNLLVPSYIDETVSPLSINFLLDPDGEVIIPDHSHVYKVSDGNKLYFFNDSTQKYVEYDREGLYLEYTETNLPDKPLSRVSTTSELVKTYKDLTTPVDAYIVVDSTPLSSGWLTLKSGDPALTPNNGDVYKIKTEGEYLDSIYEWNNDNNSYEIYAGNGIIYINEDDTQQRILSLDLSPAFNEIPTQKQLRDAANKYISDNDLSTVKDSITVSFIKLSDSSEYSNFKELEKVELGDTISIIYDKLGVSSTLRVINTIYNVITDKYDEIELGKKVNGLSDTAVCRNDGISTLVNDKQYADETTVNNLIAKTITADLIKAKNAELSEAQINQLKAEKIVASGVIEASQADIDKVVANLLVANDAEVKNMLTAGKIAVKGNVDVTSGSITIHNAEYTIMFEVNQNGELTANAVTIQGGSISIKKSDNTTYFNVDNEGNVEANSLTVNGGHIQIKKSDNTTYFNVDDEGNVEANSLHIKGGTIEIKNQNDEVAFKVNADGNVNASNLSINGGNIIFKDENGNTNLLIDNYGRLTAKNVNIISGTLELNSQEINQLIVGNRIYFGGTGENNAAFSSKILSHHYVRYIVANINTTVLDNRTLKYVVQLTSYADIDHTEFLPFPEEMSIPIVIKYWKINTFIYKTFIIEMNTSQYWQFTDPILDDIICGTATLVSVNNQEVAGNASTYYSSLDFNILQSAASIESKGNFIPYQNEAWGNLNFSLGDTIAQWNDLYIKNSPIITSDKRAKKNINYDISKYDKMFFNLKPASYQMRKGASGRTHLGFIAQDVEKTMKDTGVSDKEFAGLIKSQKNTEISSKRKKYIYALRYDELHAMEVRQIQLLKLKVEQLENEIKILKDKNDKEE